MAFQPSPERVRTALHATLRYRWLLMFSWVWSVFGLLFALLPFFLGNLRLQAHQGFAMFVIDISSLGRGLYENDQDKSELAQHIRNLVPANLKSPVSITKYLGLHDWYTVTYFWLCQGAYRVAIDKEGHPVRTNTMLTSSCRFRPLARNHTFSLRDEVQSGLNPAVSGLLDNIPSTNFDVDATAWIWMSGFICVALIVILLPLAFQRTKALGGKHWCLATCFLAFASAVIFSFAWFKIEYTAHILAADFINVEILANFRTLTILCIVSMGICCVLGLMGYGGGLLINCDPPRKFSDQEKANGVASSSEEVRPTRNTGSDILQRVNDHESISDGGAAGKKRKGSSILKQPMRHILPDPIIESEESVINGSRRASALSDTYEQYQTQLKHAVDHFVECLAQQKARLETSQNIRIECPMCSRQTQTA